jgi:NAD(P)-dependent dehydrogenase (short-subunit alcohol dehydrogenase family)
MVMPFSFVFYTSRGGPYSQPGGDILVDVSQGGFMPSVVLVSGSSTGIGRLVVETAARAGHFVYATMRDLSTRNASAADALQELARKENLSLRILEMDVCDAASVQRAVDQVQSDAGRIDVVVNNAGLMSIGLAEGFTEDQVQHQMDVNFMGPFRVSRAALPIMRAQRSGLIIHVTSIVGRLLFPACAFYCASKFAHEALAEVLHYELKGLGVESVIVEPGPYPSQLLPNSPAPADSERNAGYGDLSALREQFVAHFSQLFASKDAPRTQDVADAVLRLIDLPAGTRPMRTVCGLDFGANGLNESIASVQADVLRALGMEPMIPGLVSNHVGKASA